MDVEKDEIRLHHVGFIVLKIQDEIQRFMSSLSATWDEKVIYDPLQKVRVTFLQNADPADPLIELVEPAAEDSPALAFLHRGGGIHHLCYEVSDLDAHLSKLRSPGLVVVKKPLPAVAFQNRRIAWVSTKQKLLLEFLESAIRRAGIEETASVGDSKFLG